LIYQSGDVAGGLESALLRQSLQRLAGAAGRDEPDPEGERYGDRGSREEETPAELIGRSRHGGSNG
jgi:hypothetical protein